jgi:hypothetical protein
LSWSVYNALAWRQERGERTEASVLGDLWALARVCPKAVEALRADFPVPVPGGCWRCTIMVAGDGARVIAVRLKH